MSKILGGIHHWKTDLTPLGKIVVTSEGHGFGSGGLPIQDVEVCQTCPPFLVGGLAQKINICKAGLKMMVKQTSPP